MDTEENRARKMTTKRIILNFNKFEKFNNRIKTFLEKKNISINILQSETKI